MHNFSNIFENTGRTGLVYNFQPLGYHFLWTNFCNFGNMGLTFAIFISSRKTPSLNKARKI